MISPALTVALDAPWAIDEFALRSLLATVGREEALQAYRAPALDGAETATVRDGVAIIPVVGPLFKRESFFSALFGASSYDVILRDFTAALDNTQVRAILLNVDSPGGEAAGAAELAQAIYSARGQKPIVAYGADIMASAAFWIGSAADRIVIGKSAAVGSIGVRAAIRGGREDGSYTFVSSQSPHKISDPATDAGAARIQARIDALAQVFVEAVAEHRNVEPGKVLDSYGRGDVLVGSAALAAGMVDGVSTFEATLASMKRDLDAPKPIFSLYQKGSAMTSPSATSAAEEAAKVAAGKRILAEMEARKAAEAVRAEAERRASWGYGKTQAEIDAEYARLKALRESDKMVADVLGAVGLTEPPNAFTPIVARKPLEFDEADVLKFAREEAAARDRYNRAR